MTGKENSGPARVSRIWDGVEFAVAREDIRQTTLWSFHEPRSIVIVHLGGPIRELETELDGCAGLLDPPMRGEVWLLPAGTRYASKAKGGIVRYAELFIDQQVLSGATGGAGPARLTPRAGQYDSFLHACVRQLEGLLRDGSDTAEMMRRSLTGAICVHLRRTYSDGPAAPVRRQHFWGKEGSARLREFIDDHLAGRLTLETLAALMDVSVHQLLIAFRQSFSVTPAQYIIDRRLRRARWLLSQTDEDITRIALETGFGSHSHLTATFTKRVGIAPRDYRESQRSPRRHSLGAPINGVGL